MWNYNFSSKEESLKIDRKALEKKVEKGTDRAIKDYRGAFEKLAEYDRTV